MIAFIPGEGPPLGVEQERGGVKRQRAEHLGLARHYLNYRTGPPNCASRDSTSVLAGAEVCAPARVTEIAAAAFANRNAYSNSAPSASDTASAALNVSPAAVESTARTGNGGVANVRS